MGFAQWALAILMVAEVVAAFFVDGRPRPPFSFNNTLAETLWLFIILHAGGFWR